MWYGVVFYFKIGKIIRQIAKIRLQKKKKTGCQLLLPTRKGRGNGVANPNQSSRWSGRRKVRARVRVCLRRVKSAAVSLSRLRRAWAWLVFAGPPAEQGRDVGRRRRWTRGRRRRPSPETFLCTCCLPAHQQTPQLLKNKNKIKSQIISQPPGSSPFRASYFVVLLFSCFLSQFSLVFFSFLLLLLMFVLVNGYGYKCCDAAAAAPDCFE